MPTVLFLEILRLYNLVRSSSHANVVFFNLSDFGSVFQLLKHAENVKKWKWLQTFWISIESGGRPLWIDCLHHALIISNFKIWFAATFTKIGHHEDPTYNEVSISPTS